MRLHGYFRSSTSYRIRIALNLKGLDYEYVAVNLRTGEQKDEAFASYNPHKTVPVLECEEGSFSQSLAIVAYLEERFPTPSFVPRDFLAAQNCRELYYAVASEVHAPCNLTVLNYLKEHFDADQARLEHWNQTWIGRTFDAVETRLGQIQWQSEALPFGDPSLFEIVLIPQIYNARRWKCDLSRYPLLSKIDEHCAGLDAFAKAHPAQQPDAPKEA